MRVLVTDGDERAALAVVRALGRDHEVHVVGDSSNSLAGGSRFCSKQHSIVPGVSMAARVSDLATNSGIDVIFPISDASCAALLPKRESLAPAVLVGPSFEAYQALSDKALVAELAAENGIRIPRGVEAATLPEARDFAKRFGWPVVVKPTHSVVEGATGVLTKTAVSVASDLNQLEAAWSGLPSGSRVLVQSFVEGHGEGIFVLRWGGRTVAAFAHRRLREKPPSGGVSVLRESIPLDPEGLGRVEKILDRVGFEGAAMAEFKTHGKEQNLMEFNGRLWGSLQLSLDAGVNFPELLVECACGNRPTPVTRYQTGVRSRWLMGDVDHAIALARGGRTPNGETGVFAATRVLLKPAGPRCRWEVFRLSDPVPFVREVVRWLLALLKPS